MTVDKDMHTVFCYDPIPNKWTTLPPLPIRYFGLGRVNGTLVAVGGLKKGEDSSNEVYKYDERSRKWKQTIPPMPTARCFPGVMSRQFALVVAGGYTSSSSYSAAVEIFKPDTSQWYRTDPLPTACCNVSIVAIGNTCCVLGGYKHPSNLNQALYATNDDLLHNAVPVNQITHSGSCDTQSAWKTLPNAPTYRPAAAVLAGNLLAVGGKEMPEGGVDKGEVYMYSPSINSWLYISDLPAPRSNSTVAIWSSTQVMVIGGQGKDTRVNTVCVGTFTIS